MKNRVALFVLLIVLFNDNFSFGGTLWRPVDVRQLARSAQAAQHFLVFALDETMLRSQLTAASTTSRIAQTIELPLPDGSFRQFRIWQTALLPGKLAAKYPELQTFAGEAVDDPHVTAKLDFTVFGFHAMIFDGGSTSFVDPYNRFNDGNYMVHYKRDETRPQESRAQCVVSNDDQLIPGATRLRDARDRSGQRTMNGHDLRTYRLALVADNFYAQAATNLAHPTIAQTLSAMATTMNRVNGVYERELSVSMTFVENEDTLIWPSATGSINGPDPFNAINASAGACLDSCQAVCDRRIGNLNYDIGHAFTTGAGGQSQIGIVCRFGQKALSVTGQSNPVGDGFDVDYVAHEMGHEFGAGHTFNGSSGNCGGGNIATESAYEPGSGSSIMAYAGICSPDNLQPHSDAYFHSASLIQIQHFLSTIGDGCPLKTPTGNKPVAIAPFQASYTIPFLTPFELTAPTAVDSVADTSITYCWEQWNLGDFNSSLLNTHQYGPIFRSFTPVKQETRIFPKKSLVLSGVLSDAGIDEAEGEKAPDVARFLTFQLTVRDIYQGNGCFLVPDDTVHLDVINTGNGFKVTSQNVAGLYYIGGSPETVTWDVASTNNAPISTPNVDIYMSVDGGNNWPYFLGTFPNTGTAIVTFPNPDTDTHAARIKVKGNGNIFFNVNAADFAVNHSLDPDNDIVVYPVPVRSILRMFGGNKGILETTIFNSVGQQVWKGQINGETDVSVALWPRGVYIIRIIDVRNKRTIKKFVVE